MVSRVRERMVDGHLEMRARGRRPLRSWELRDESGSLAVLGARSWLSIYIGRGQHIRLADGRSGRIAATGLHNWIVPVVVDDRGNTVARATPGPHGSYTIDTVEEGLNLVPMSTRTWRSKPTQWELRSWDEAVASLTVRPETIDTSRPIPLAAVFLAFTVMSLGIPGEFAIGTPRLQW